MPDVSPTKWHLAHVTWFFERFVLEPNVRGFTCFDDQYHYLFNSYYYSAGQMHARPKRGLLSRPTLAQIFDYRSYVDTAMQQLLQTGTTDEQVFKVITLGLNHEQQHQELLLTDIKHVFSCNPIHPPVSHTLDVIATSAVTPYSYSRVDAGIRPIGAVGSNFAFDNETPRHDALLHEHRIGNRLVTNGEYREFINDGGYEALEKEFTLGGDREIDNNAPVCHVSYYEADAFARWTGARLPTEFEWETAAGQQAVSGNLLESRHWHPVAAAASQFFGDVWEWTSSSYAAYPGFKPLDGTLGEYNGKFMCNQMTVRGGSCVTARDQIRSSYRSFFYPDARWQFLGVRLAKDGHGS